MLIDTHCHIDNEKLAAQTDEIVAEAARRGIGYMVNCGADMPSSRSSAALAERYPSVYAAVGVHPHAATQLNEAAIEELSALSKGKKVLAIGEIGLDYYYDFSPREVQRTAFARQLELADSLKMPVILHVRDAYADALAILREQRDRLKSGVLLHCYSGSMELVRDFNAFDCYYAFGGAVTFAKYKDIVVNAVPKDRLLLETDSPYMTPVPFRGKVNYPYYVTLVRDKMAELLGVTAEETERQTTENAMRFFRFSQDN